MAAAQAPASVQNRSPAQQGFGQENSLELGSSQSAGAAPPATKQVGAASFDPFLKLGEPDALPARLRRTEAQHEVDSIEHRT